MEIGLNSYVIFHYSSLLIMEVDPSLTKTKESVKERAMQMDIVANLLDVINLQYLGVSFYGFYDFRKTMRRRGHK